MRFRVQEAFDDGPGHVVLDLLLLRLVGHLSCVPEHGWDPDLWSGPSDERFTLALVVDVAEVLGRYGYPAAIGLTLAELTVGLYRTARVPVAPSLRRSSRRAGIRQVHIGVSPDTAPSAAPVPTLQGALPGAAAVSKRQPGTAYPGGTSVRTRSVVVGATLARR